jgi:non-specific serine/threonine protein kinase/serine/threonine-protein kinase
MQRIIRETDPPRPSTKLGSLGAGATAVAARRRTELPALRRELSGELEWIPLKAMRKDRTERYATAAELARDIQNYLANRPLIAGPESAAYRLRKFLRRNKAGVAASAAMLLLLLTAIAGTTWQAYRATRAERLAQDERRAALAANENTRAVNDFLTQDLLVSADPNVSLGETLTVKQALDAAARSVGERFTGRPLIEASVRLALATTYNGLGRADLALPHAQASHAARRTLLGADHADTVLAAAELSDILVAVGQYADAERLARDAYERGARALGEGHRHTMTSLRNLAHAIREQGRLGEAELLYRRALERSLAHFGADDSDTIVAMGNLAAQLFQQERYDEAETLARDATRRVREIAGPRSPQYLTTVNNLAVLLRVRGKLDEAEALDRELLAQRRDVLGDDHPDTLMSMNNLGTLLGDRGKTGEAVALLREVVDRTRALAGDDHPDTLLFTNNLAYNLNRAGRYDEAEELYKRALDGRRRSSGELHPDTLNTALNLAALYDARQRHADAEPLLADACRPEALAALTTIDQAMVVSRYGVCLARLGRDAQAEPILLDALRRLREAQQLRGNRIRETVRTLATICARTNRPDEASRWNDELAALDAATRSATVPGTSAK